MTRLTGFDLCRASLAVEGVTAPEQSVLTTLAIMANGDAQCWPGVAGLVAKTKLSERTVQRSLQGLKEAGHISWVDKPGRGRIYVVHPRHSGTPEDATPATVAPLDHDPRQSDTPNEATPVTLTPRHSGTPVTVAPTPATVAPKQPRTTTSQKTTSSSKARESSFELPDDVPADEWAAYEEMRKSIKKPMTDSIRGKAVDLLHKLARDGHPPGGVLSQSTFHCWAGLFPIKGDRNEQRNGSHSIAGNRGGARSGFGSTVDAGFDFIADGGPH